MQYCYGSILLLILIQFKSYLFSIHYNFEFESFSYYYFLNCFIILDFWVCWSCNCKWISALNSHVSNLVDACRSQFYINSVSNRVWEIIVGCAVWMILFSFTLVEGFNIWTCEQQFLKCFCYYMWTIRYIFCCMIKINLFVLITYLISI